VNTQKAGKRLNALNTGSWWELIMFMNKNSQTSSPAVPTGPGKPSDPS